MTKRLHKRALYKQVAARCALDGGKPLNQPTIRRVTKRVLETLVAALADGYAVDASPLGRLYTITKRPYRMRRTADPRDQSTVEYVMTNPRRQAYLKPSPVLNQTIRRADGRD